MSKQIEEVCTLKELMEENKIAQKIGYTQAFKAITIGLIAAYFIMSLMAGPIWIFELSYASTILFSILMIYLAGYVLGGIAGQMIIKKKWPAVLVGIITGFLIVWYATFSGSLIGFFQEGIRNGNSWIEAFHDYIIKPFLLITYFGSIPIILTGIWFGLTIKKRSLT
jgi:hypothetical protein